MKRCAQNPRLISKTVRQNPRTLVTWHVTCNADNKRAQSPSSRRGAIAILRLVRGLTSARARSGIPRHSGNIYRPILFSNDTTKVEMAYDYIGRRFEYKETMNGTLTRHDRYLYRGYLQIAAQDILNSASVKHAIAWDPTEPTATRPLALHIGAESYFYSFDQVKNVTELFDSTGTLAATYDYSPFGQVTSALSVGSSAFDVASNPLTFSSEIHDPALGLQYYNYRHLNLLDGRWVNRDPIGERGGLALYEICDNDMLDYSDVLGAVGFKGGGGRKGGGGGRKGGGGGRKGGGGGSEYIPNKPPTEPPKTPGGEPGKTFPIIEKITDIITDILDVFGSQPPPYPKVRTLMDANSLCRESPFYGKDCFCCVAFCQIEPQDDGPPDFSCSLLEASQRKSPRDPCPSHPVLIPGDGSFIRVLKN